MSGISSATSISQPSPRGETLRIYIDYNRLRLSTLRLLLSDVESSYNRIERHFAEVRSPGRRRIEAPLWIERVETGQSIVYLLSGSSDILQVFALVLQALHSTWTGVGVAGALAVGRATKIVELRNKWLDGQRTLAETKKIDAETSKTQAEERKADAEAIKTSLEATKLRRELETADRFGEGIHSFAVSPAVDEPEALVEGLAARLRALARSSEVKRVEITAGGTKLMLAEDGSVTLSETDCGVGGGPPATPWLWGGPPAVMNGAPHDRATRPTRRCRSG